MWRDLIETTNNISLKFGLELQRIWQGTEMDQTFIFNITGRDIVSGIELVGWIQLEICV